MAKWVAAVIAGFLLLLFAALVVGWLLTGTFLFMPGNVRAKWQFAYENEEALHATAAQWCVALTAERSTTGDVRAQRTSQRIAIEQNYARLAAQYDASMRDAFRTGLVRPSDVAAQAPELKEIAPC
jgi:hypothetical protein